jgi:hypothetical protein
LLVMQNTLRGMRIFLLADHASIGNPSAKSFPLPKGCHRKIDD